MIDRLRRGQLPNWVIPALYALAAVVTGLVLPRVEARLVPGIESSWSAAAALAMLSSIGSGGWRSASIATATGCCAWWSRIRRGTTS